MSEKKARKISGDSITRLQYNAQGFREAFYVLYNSLMNKDGCENWHQNGDGLSVLATNGCFSLELYFKLLIVIANFSPINNSSEFYQEHHLSKLYDYLSEDNSTFTDELEKLFESVKFKNEKKNLKEFLNSIDNYFIDWRYSFEKDKLSINLNVLSDLLNLLEKYSEDKFRPVFHILDQLEPRNYEEQNLIIEDSDLIRMEGSITPRIFIVEKNT